MATKQNTPHDKSLRLLALDLPVRLPEDPDDALKVVAFMKVMVSEFFGNKFDDPVEGATQLLTLVRRDPN